MDDIAARLSDIRSRIARAAQRAGRNPDTIRLIAVSKTFPAELVVEAHQAGQQDFGENRVQEGLGKIDSTPGLSLRWHLLGHLQSNKVRRAAAAFSVIHSIDSLEILKKVDAAAAEAGASPELLIQIDLAGEATKTGVPPADAWPLIEAASSLRAARLAGLMTLPPYPEKPEDSRPWFRQLRELRDQWIAAGAPAAMLLELSMGMSGDFEVAVEEGATMVRVGTAIFGRRVRLETKD